MTDNSQETLKSCVTLDATKIKSDLRMAYPKGLVLGVDEFVQEQQYFLEKNYLHNRSLHGYGTAYGLAITLDTVGISGAQDAPDMDEPEEVKTCLELEGNTAYLKISRGVGVDQHGRTFVLRKTYCLNLGDWWDAHKPYENVNADDPDKQAEEENEGNENVEDKNTYTLFIHARYDELCKDKATIAGQPCTINAVSQEYSRIQDSVFLELSSIMPVMPAWDNAKRYAWFTSQIYLVPDVTRNEALEKDLVNYVRQSLWVVDDNNPNAFADELDRIKRSHNITRIELPEGTVETVETLNNIGNAYATYVAPRGYFIPDPYETITDYSFANILLGTVIVTTAEDDPEEIIKVCFNYDDRPHLLATQVAQATGESDKSGKHRRKEFATLHVEDNHNLLVWLHRNVKLQTGKLSTAGLELRLNGSRVDGVVEATEDPDLYKIKVEKAISWNAHVELIFTLSALRNLDDTLIDIDDYTDYVGLSELGTTITVYTFADSLSCVRQLATIHSEPDNESGGFNLIVRFLYEVKLERDNTPKDAITIVANAAGAITTFQASVVDSTTWRILIMPQSNVVINDLLVVQLNTSLIHIGDNTINAHMSAAGYSFLGYDNRKGHINVPVVISSPGLTKEEVTEIATTVVNETVPGMIDEEIAEIVKLLNIRTLPFATITPQINTDEENNEYLEFEIWMHPVTAPKHPGYSITFTGDTPLSVYAEGANRVTPVIEGVPTTTNLPNVFTMRPTLPADNPPDLSYLRFVFDTTQIQFRGWKMDTFIKNFNIRFDGYYVESDATADDDNENDDTVTKQHIIIYVRNSLVPSPPIIIVD